ncbi:hypothetical protein FSP39_008271 [Pinctada imbricata]|uniref:Uncharacterized protein n=1 Tax=Pinctada imbricata TaxID=66713 RepID=A0AA89BYA8_PINIB|nr:hypothetical protein FSP39_008271 [Pinctada imbricata]
MIEVGVVGRDRREASSPEETAHAFRKETIQVTILCALARIGPVKFYYTEMGDIDCGNCDCGNCDCGNCDADCCDCGDCGDCCGCGDDCFSEFAGCCFCFCPGPHLDVDGHHVHRHDHHGSWCPPWTWLYCDCCETNSSRGRRGREQYVGNNVNPSVYGIDTGGNIQNGGSNFPNNGNNLPIGGGDVPLPNRDSDFMMTGSSVSGEVVTTQPPPAYADVVGNEQCVVSSQPKSGTV